MSDITNISRDELTGYRTGRCGSWVVRSRNGSSFDLASQPFRGWDKVDSEFIGLTLDQAARLLCLPQGELYNWGKGEL